MNDVILCTWNGQEYLKPLLSHFIYVVSNLLNKTFLVTRLVVLSRKQVIKTPTLRFNSAHRFSKTPRRSLLTTLSVKPVRVRIRVGKYTKHKSLPTSARARFNNIKGLFSPYDTQPRVYIRTHSPSTSLQLSALKMFQP